MRIIIVTGSDSDFWSIAKGAVDTLWGASNHDSELSLGFLDDGLEPWQIKHLLSMNFSVAPTRWDPCIPEAFQKGFPGSRVKVSKTMLPEIFPGFDVYIWVDGDAWLQEESVVRELVQEALTHEVSLVSARNRRYSFKQYANRWRLSRAKEYFGLSAALNVLTKPYFNSGVFAMKSSSRVWSAWRSVWSSALTKRKQSRFSDEAALNHLITTQKVRVAKFSATHNWVSHLARPYWDGGSGKWRTSKNGQLIKVLHMTAKTKSDADLHYRIPL